MPLEFCEIPPGQATNKKCTSNCVRALIKFSATSTDERKKKIRDLLNRISYESDPTIKGFGINIDKNFQKTDARVIDAPNLKYKNNAIVKPKKGVWNGETFMEANPQNIKWCIVNCDSRTNIRTLMNFKNSFINEARKHSILLTDINTTEIISFNFNDRRANLSNTFNDWKSKGYQLIVVILNDYACPDGWSFVKQAAELNVGILTQCIKSVTLEKRMNQSTIGNILLKLNAKLDGKNHEIEEISYKTINSVNSGVMFVGAVSQFFFLKL